MYKKYNLGDLKIFNFPQDEKNYQLFSQFKDTNRHPIVIIDKKTKKILYSTKSGKYLYEKANKHIAAIYDEYKFSNEYKNIQHEDNDANIQYYIIPAYWFAPAFYQNRDVTDEEQKYIDFTKKYNDFVKNNNISSNKQMSLLTQDAALVCEIYKQKPKVLKNYYQLAFNIDDVTHLEEYGIPIIYPGRIFPKKDVPVTISVNSVQYTITVPYIEEREPVDFRMKEKYVPHVIFKFRTYVNEAYDAIPK